VELEPDATSFFKESFERWQDMNGSASFFKFSREIRLYVNSLPQILHHKEQIARALLTHLATDDSLALQPLLK
jgi:U3 small nucleolar RNA-associated protein 20